MRDMRGIRCIERSERLMRPRPVYVEDKDSTTGKMCGSGR